VLNHIFKLIWKKKKSNFLMMLEIFVSFLILFAVWSLSVYTYRNYVTPAGLSTDRVWAVYLQFNTDSDSLRRINCDLVSQYLKGNRGIESFAFSSSNLPFGFSTMNNQFEYGGKSVMSDNLAVSADYPSVLGIQMLSGRWFTAADTVGSGKPVVITRRLAAELFGKEEPIGKRISTDRRVVGVVDYFRHKSSFQADENALFEPMNIWDNDLLVKVAPGTDAEFEAQLARSIQKLGKDWTVEIQHLDNMKSTQDKTILIPILILFGVCGFLVFNVGLGLFGVLFQNISRRRGEIGIRRAVGATKKQIMRYFISETLVIATFGVALGVFFAVQIPLLNVFDVEGSVYFWGIVLATLSIYGIAVLCAFYPSRQAAVIYPAVALHEE
jgi:putative ABC transport system permease protein